jgi:hypothetical protein
MYDKLQNQISFPHIIPFNKLGDKTHTWNDVDGGSVKIADLCIEQNEFWGGNVILLGWIKMYGMYACLHKDSNELIGFYVHEPQRLTALGKRLIEEAFPARNVLFEIIPEKKPTREELDDVRKVKEYYKEHGMSPVLVDTSNLEELKSLERALESGRASKQLGIAEQDVVEPVLKEDVVHEHDGSTVSPKILEGRAQPRGSRGR